MNAGDYAIHAFSVFSPIFQDIPRCAPSSLDFVYKAETSVQRAVPLANFHFSVRTRRPIFRRIGPQKRFLYDNGRGA
jgi:hypothetical protein